jgi:Xaa-Pro aminopeptidase
MRNFCNGAVVLTDGDLIFYYSGFYVDDGYLVICNGKNHLLTDGRYIESAKKQAKAECYLQSETSLFDLLKTLNVKKIGLIYDYTSAKVYENLLKSGFELYDYTSEHNELAMVKSTEQLTLIKKSCEICEQAFLNVLPFIKEGITELELSAELERNFKRLGAGVGFKTIVAFGAGSSVPHYETSDKKLEPNTPILMDFGCVYKGFLSDMTRTLFFGEPTDKFLKVYELVKTAHLTAVDKITAGITCKQADEIARGVLRDGGYDKFFTHSLGHGIGVKIHEYPSLSPKCQEVLKDGAVFSVEPGVYLEGEFGIRIEDTVTLANGKCLSLMKTDKNLLVIKG